MNNRHHGRLLQAGRGALRTGWTGDRRGTIVGAELWWGVAPVLRAVEAISQSNGGSHINRRIKYCNVAHFCCKC